MGMLPRLAGQWIEVSTASSGVAGWGIAAAARLRTLLDMMFGSYRGVFILLSAVLSATGQVTAQLAISAVFIVMSIPYPFIAVGIRVGRSPGGWRPGSG